MTFNWLFNRYWWLLFPLCWGIGAMFKNWMRHKRAQTALDVIQSYAAQGKDAPAELMAVLRQPERDMPRLNSGNFGTYGWIPVFLFGALACGFVLLAAVPPDAGVPRPAMLFVAFIMTGLCVGNLVALKTRQKQDANQDRNPPQ